MPPVAPSPVWALLELEARASGRTESEHLAHILDRRYSALRRICECGFFVYQTSDDLTCAGCGRRCCCHCSVPEDARDYCVAMCRPDREGGGFRR